MLYRATQYIDELSELDPRYVSVQTMLNDATYPSARGDK